MRVARNLGFKLDEASLADRHVEASIGWSVANVGSGLSTAVAEADAPRPDTPTAWGMPDPYGLDASRDDARTHAFTNPDRLFDTEKEPTR